MQPRQQERDLIFRVGPATPAGAMFRRYWWPALLSEEIAEPDGAPVRVRLLGENFVAFRDSAGRPGLLAEACPHRLASLVLGRNEEGGLRCIYHGWKFGVDGACLEMPTEPEGYNFRERLRARAYAVREAGGFVWAYIGPPELEPAFPAFDFTEQPREQIAIVKVLEHANYLQVTEGAIDSAHTSILHRGMLFGIEEQARRALSADLSPKIEVADTEYGFRYTATRRPNAGADTLQYVKITRFVFPTTAVTARPLTNGYPAITQFLVPVDDEHTMNYPIWHSLDGSPIDEAQIRDFMELVPGVHLDPSWRPRRTEANWWGQDRAAMRAGSFTGMPGTIMQDQAVQESMGAITDHAREHLGTSDVAVIRLRRRMRDCVQRFMDGLPPIGLERPLDYAKLTHVTQGTITLDARWQDVEAYPGEYPEPNLAPV
jgi:phthalate 4,5-dioxygenase